MKVEIALPVFNGFYGTHFECNCEENEIEAGKTYDDYDFDYEDYNERIAKACVSKVETKLKEVGFDCLITYQSIYSPREYNFTNDSVNVLIQYSKINLKNIIENIKENYSTEFERHLDENFKSRSGFSSFFSHDPVKWYKKYLKSKHERFPTALYSLLEFYLEMNDYTDSNLAIDICDEDWINAKLKEE